ncbi:1889_t:CDS:2, partial [Funneliformis mosseae]
SSKNPTVDLEIFATARWNELDEHLDGLLREIAPASMIACWWDSNNHTNHVTNFEELGQPSKLRSSKTLEAPEIQHDVMEVDDELIHLLFHKLDINYNIAAIVRLENKKCSSKHSNILPPNARNTVYVRFYCLQQDEGRRRKWMIDDAITRNERSMEYFVDPKERNVTFLDSLCRIRHDPLHESRSLKPKRRLYLYIIFDAHLCLDASEYNELDINSASDFSVSFQKNKWDYQVVLIIDEFDRLYKANDDVKFSCLETLRNIKPTREKFAIWSIVVT